MIIVDYVEAIGRNPGEDLQHSHLYAVTDTGDYIPMCKWGWNRDNGGGYSIFRGHSGKRGLCKVCETRRDQGLSPLTNGAPHPTKWL